MEVKMDKSDALQESQKIRQMDDHGVKILLKEYDSMKELFIMAETNVRNVLNSYLTSSYLTVLN